MRKEKFDIAREFIGSIIVAADDVHIFTLHKDRLSCRSVSTYFVAENMSQMSQMYVAEF